MFTWKTHHNISPNYKFPEKCIVRKDELHEQYITSCIVTMRVLTIVWYTIRQSLLCVITCEYALMSNHPYKAGM